nr:atherin-like [Aegilops tauschii subsp. strangulata]
MTRKTTRSSCAQQRGEGVAVAVVVLVGGLGCVRTVTGESQRGDGDEQAVEGGAGECVASLASSRRSAASRKWGGVASVQRARALVPSGTRLKMTGAEEVDWAGSTGRTTLADRIGARSHARASSPTTPPPGPRRRLFPTGLLPPPPPACFLHLNGLPPRRPVVAVNRLAPRCQSPYGPSEPQLAPSLSLVRSRSLPRSPPISPAVDALRPRPMRAHRAVPAPAPRPSATVAVLAMPIAACLRPPDWIKLAVPPRSTPPPYTQGHRATALARTGA